jgi:DNA polymerase (family 10)
MPVHNSDIADLFDEVADLLEIQAANPFRVRAYRNASRVVRNWPVSLSSVLKRGEKLPKIPGVGEDLAEKIREAASTRNLAMLESLRKKTSQGVLELLQIPGLGPKKIARLGEELSVGSIADLEDRLTRGKVSELTGFGKRTEEKLLFEIRNRARAPSSRMSLIRAEQVAWPLLSFLQESGGVSEMEIAGSLRRRCESVGDIDILISCRKPGEIMRRFLSYEDIDRVVAEGPTRSTVILHSQIQVDLRVVEERSFGAALHYFTGSKAHNIAVRMLGVKRGLKINEYGVFRGNRRVAGRTEEEVFAQVGLPYIDPELRENQGEIEAAARGELPSLVRLSDIRGDLHSHTNQTDGHASVREMAAAARSLGYEYLAITDHSQRLAMTGGLDSKRLLAQMDEIDRLNEELKGFRVLKSIEVDILEDGRLDLPRQVLSRLDLVVASIHSYFDLSADRQLRRVVRAMDQPYCHILGHPSGRLLGARPRRPLQLDMEKLMLAAKERGRFLEINCQPERMDLSDNHCRLAGEIGVGVVISTDAHSTQDLNYMRLGVSQARRGWLSRQDVLNTRSWREIEVLIRQGEAYGRRDAFGLAA